MILVSFMSLQSTHLFLFGEGFGLLLSKYLKSWGFCILELSDYRRRVHRQSSEGVLCVH